MKKTAATFAALAAVALLATGYFRLPSSVPAGQESLVELSDSNFDEFAAAFDANPDLPRLVLLLSPT